eukprot:scpid16521/ scgid18943/ 
MRSTRCKSLRMRPAQAQPPQARAALIPNNNPEEQRPEASIVQRAASVNCQRHPAVSISQQSASASSQHQSAVSISQRSASVSGQHQSAVSISQRSASFGSINSHPHCGDAANHAI